MKNCKYACGHNSLACSAELTVLLQPGDWFFGDRSACARTTLGSCVAFTFWHPQHRLGGICHYMLPHRAGTPAASGLDGRYADEAFELLRQAARNYDTRLRDYETKLFGGAEMFQAPGRAVSSVALRNVATARGLVKQHGLRLVSESLGGTSYRQVVFSIASGDVWVKCGPSAMSARREHVRAGGDC